jgi:hypothetical protein
MADIRSVVGNLLPNIKRSEVSEDLRLLIEDIRDRTLPIYKTSLDHFAEVGFSDKEVKDFDSVFGNSVIKMMGRDSIRIRGTYVEGVHDILLNASNILDKVQKDVENVFDKNIVREGLDYRKTSYLNLISICNFINKYSNKLLYWTFDKEQSSKGSLIESPLNKAEMKWMLENRQAFFKACLICSYEVDKIAGLLKNIPIIQVIGEDALVVEQNLGKGVVDPFGSAAFGLNVINPIYSVRMMIAGYQVKKYKLRKEEVKSLQYRLLLLKELENEEKDPELEQEIEFVESRIEKLKYKLAKMEEG